ncbi:hypothetical protein QWZ06_08010 [Chryseobacterium tructae]|uniref:Lipoprotein n=1 Tax=Chryseobacterium tructae TaxID=1037380 RepID=A0ABV7XXF3_9FLAO|nr:hypothetical protein [Chryseobacterium tructae]MDN3692210.1 hypothetical protein [Chryseobacterium tructae]
MSGKYLFLVISLSFFSCKKENKQTESHITDKNVPEHQKEKFPTDTPKIKADTVITTPTILLLSPDEKEIEEIKKKQGEDNFYTIADDANYYSAEIYEAAPKVVYSHHKIIHFPKENDVFDKNKSENKWLIIDYKIGAKPKIYTLVDYYLHLTQK